MRQIFVCVLPQLNNRHVFIMLGRMNFLFCQELRGVLLQRLHSVNERQLAAHQRLLTQSLQDAWRDFILRDDGQEGEESERPKG